MKVMIVAGEASGDLHGAGLIRALRRRVTELEACGMGGPELAGSGVDLLCDAAKVSVVGVFEVFSHLGDILAALRRLRQRLSVDPPDLLILIDLPDFNLLLAKTAKQAGIPVFYYITPQVWAWRPGRLHTIRQRVDQLAVILPFEETYFRERGLAAHYVGHPLLDSVRARVSPAEFRRSHGIPPEADLVGLIPGSRQREVATLLPVMLGAAEKLQQHSSTPLVFCIPRAATISPELLGQAMVGADGKGLDLRVISDDRYSLMAACRAVVAASGTVTLELAILGIPMVVVYKLSWLSFHLGRMLVKLDYFSLVNLIAGYRAVPELLQDEVHPGAIAERVADLLTEGGTRQEMLASLALVRSKLGEPGASDRAAQMAWAMLNPSQARGTRPTAPPELVVIGPTPVLDLHHFSPHDLRTLIPDYLAECREHGLTEVRIVHGKGTGQLRRSVHALLQRNELVERYRLADPQSGGWGATEVWLRGDRRTGSGGQKGPA